MYACNNNRKKKLHVDMCIKHVHRYTGLYIVNLYHYIHMHTHRLSLGTYVFFFVVFLNFFFLHVLYIDNYNYSQLKKKSQVSFNVSDSSDSFSVSHHLKLFNDNEHD